MDQAQLQTAEAEFTQRTSASMDGEVAAHEMSSAVELAKGAEGAAHWRRYQPIDDVLRSEDLLNTCFSEGFVSRFLAKLDVEPRLLMPATVQRVKAQKRHRFPVGPARIRRIMPTTVVTAVVAAVNWVVVPRLRGSADGTDGSPALVVKATQGGGTQALTATTTDSTSVTRDTRLGEYLSAHRQSTTNGIMIPYLRAVANGATNTQDPDRE